MKRALVIVLSVWSAPAAVALTLDIPGPAIRTEEAVMDGRVSLPEGAFADGTLPMRTTEGTVARSAWRLPGASRTLSQVLAPVRSQLDEAGFDVVFECSAVTCGGFDFRFALDLLPAPAMYVDLGRYRYLLAEGPGEALVSVLVSRGGEAQYLHLTSVSRDEGAGVSAEEGSAVPTGPIWDRLRRDGHAVLERVDFDTGSSTLVVAESAALGELARGLQAAPAARIAIVGHTDTDGGLEANLALSRLRAQAVRRTLIDRFDVDPERITAEGVAYLSPRASNATEAGRGANRRVEVVLTE
ncbi:OmpA family protein [Palleronia abyssalis]|uniref:Outer membrane protein Omp38 n=1 Tax=Palleronia abyssalis TaxID=1501240 RepID=A0A2R8BSD3_9RHOB|nr:OmpA family protein [Palleronia abyssalis]SPJ23062.1 Outer membrane protein Omp38 [Palleronia abyssalis]